MARALLAWELGSDYGHLMRFLVLARELERRGHEAVFALRDLTHVETVLHGTSFSVFQAPVWVAHVSGLPPPAGFAETLMRLGFLHASALIGLCRGWRSLIGLIAPRLLVFDYAPTALLATRGLGLPRVLVGSSFAVPPRTTPMPIYRSWRPEPLGRIVEAERLALESANAVLARLGEPSMQRLSDLLDTDDAIIAGSEEFDQYPGREGGRYWGDLAHLTHGVVPSWPGVGTKRVFAYLKPRARDFEKVLEALRTIDAAVLVHAPGISARQLKNLTTANIAFSADPVRMAGVRRECDLAICHAGASTVETIVTAGKPVLLLPLHLEQMMTAKRVQQLGAGLVVDFEKPAPDYRRLIGRLLDEESFRQAAQAVARRHASDDSHASRVARIVDRLEELMTRGEADARHAVDDSLDASVLQLRQGSA